VETAQVAHHDIEITVEEGKEPHPHLHRVGATGRQMLRVNLDAGDPVVKGMMIVASISRPGTARQRTRRVARLQLGHAPPLISPWRWYGRQSAAGVLNGELSARKTLVTRGTISEQAYQKAQLDAERLLRLESAKASPDGARRELERAEPHHGSRANGRHVLRRRAPVSGRCCG
jgi:hypothetical protein